MYQKTILSNGTRVVTERIPHVRSVSIGIWVKTGSRDEKKNENGISHFIEHMLFKGTRKRTALDIAKEIDAVGGVINASTGREYTNFYAKVLDKDFDVAVDLLSDIFLNSKFSPHEIEREREVIYQEIKMVEDTPDEYIQDIFNQYFFPENSLGFPILGHYQTISQLTKPRIAGFFKTAFLRPLRIIVSVAGKLEHERIVEKIKETIGRVQSAMDDRVLATPDPHPNIHVLHKKLEQVHLCLGTKGISQTHPFRYAAYVLNVILGGSMSSRLFQEVREKHGLAYSVFSYLSSYSDTGILGIYAGTTSDNVKKVLDIIMNELRHLREKSIQEADLEKAKEQIRGNILLSSESTDNRMGRLARGELYFGKFIPLKEILNGIEMVTTADVQQLAQDLFQQEYFSLAALGKVRERDVARGLLAL
ncbi:MAG: insulinase family protein [Deltaproteobacteria bacterium]|nr:insulinase family protein [Deltaproteobacteria bacterium]